MATSNSASRPACRYFLSGLCRFGDRCMYSHGQPNQTRDTVCRFFLQGKCIYGDHCRFEHSHQKRSPVNNCWVNSNTHTSQSLAYIDPNASSYAYADSTTPMRLPTSRSQSQNVCPDIKNQGYCKLMRNGRSCPYLHNGICDLCQKPVLHLTNRNEREKHHQLCLKQQEAKREEQLAIERSKEKVCGICLDTVWSKENDQRFGLLENCDHIFCLQCIRTWRSLSNYEHNVVKACPECRTKSDFVTPVKHWPKDNQAKEESIRNYKESLQKIHCKHFQRGDGVCPFGSKCFYLHVDKNGQPVQLGPPRRHRPRGITSGTLDELSDMFMVSLISQAHLERFLDGWDFLFNDDDEDDDDVLYGSYITDEDDLSDNDDNFSLWV